jgi:glycosyltransferase involved in cell wall biosynthesis
VDKSNGKNVLIIAYYWPPSGGSGVQRWLKFVKYLPQFGWTPYVFTPENPSFAIKDESLLNDVPNEAEIIRFPIWEPYEAFFKLSGIFGKKQTAKPTDLVSGGKKSLFQRFSTWVRGNFLIPDPRKFWVNPSVKFLEDFLDDNEIKTIITTGPPHSLHLIGLKLKKKHPKLKWIADFRDPWSEWGFLDTLQVGARARRRHQQLEAEVLAFADEIVTITPFYVRRFEALSKKKVTLLTNGFDEDDFSAITYQKSPTFLIRHVGIINEKCDPRPFMTSVQSLCDALPEFKKAVKVEFIGEVHPLFRQFVESNSTLKSISIFTGNIPHKELMKRYGNSSLLVLVLTGYKDAEGYMPGKLFEYLATGLPILGVGPVDGDASALLRTTSSSEMIGSDDLEGMVEALRQRFTEWKNSLTPVISKSGATQYSRKEITRQLTTLFR